MAFRQMVLKAMCETSVLVSVQVASQIEIRVYENAAKTHACMTVKRIMDVYHRRTFRVTSTNFFEVDVSLLNHRSFRKAATMPGEVVYITDQHYPCPTGAQASTVNSFVNVVQYRTTPDHLGKMDEHRTVKEKDEEVLQKNWLENVRIPTRFE